MRDERRQLHLPSTVLPLKSLQRSSALFGLPVDTQIVGGPASRLGQLRKRNSIIKRKSDIDSVNAADNLRKARFRQHGQDRRSSAACCRHSWRTAFIAQSSPTRRQESCRSMLWWSRRMVPRCTHPQPAAGPTMKAVHSQVSCDDSGVIRGAGRLHGAPRASLGI